MEDLHPFFLIVSSLPSFEEEEEEMVRSSRPRLSETGGPFVPTESSTLSSLAHALFHLVKR